MEPFGEGENAAAGRVDLRNQPPRTIDIRRALPVAVCPCSSTSRTAAPLVERAPEAIGRKDPSRPGQSTRTLAFQRVPGSRKETEVARRQPVSAQDENIREVRLYLAAKAYDSGTEGGATGAA